MESVEGWRSNKGKGRKGKERSRGRERNKKGMKGKEKKDIEGIEKLRQM